MRECAVAPTGAGKRTRARRDIGAVYSFLLIREPDECSDELIVCRRFRTIAAFVDRSRGSSASLASASTRGAAKRSRARENARGFIPSSESKQTERALHPGHSGRFGL